jgi:hypothetical protein
VLDLGIRLPLDNLLDLESCRRQVACHLGGAEKEEVNAYPLVPPIVQVNRLVAEVEGEQQQAARS